MFSENDNSSRLIAGRVNYRADFAELFVVDRTVALKRVIDGKIAVIDIELKDMHIVTIDHFGYLADQVIEFDVDQHRFGQVIVVDQAGVDTV